jgi:hypothetical protein
MSPPVGGVIELICPDSILQPLGMSLGLMVVVLGVVEGDSWYGVDLRAQETQQVNLAL